MKNMKIVSIFLLMLLLLTGCDSWEDEIVSELKYDLSLEYDVPISEIEIEVIEFGASIFSTNQFKIVIESKDAKFILIQTGSGTGYKRLPIK